MELFLLSVYALPWLASVALGWLTIERPRIGVGVVIGLVAGFYALALFSAPTGPGFYPVYLGLYAIYLLAGTVAALVARSAGWFLALVALAVGGLAGVWLGWREGEVRMGGEWGGFWGGVWGNPVGVFALSSLALVGHRLRGSS